LQLFLILRARLQLTSAGIVFLEAQVSKIPKTVTPINEEKVAKQLMKLLVERKFYKLLLQKKHKQLLMQRVVVVENLQFNLRQRFRNH